MRNFDPGFAAHIESGATTLCWCWKITRRDEAVFGFTDHDAGLSFSGTQFEPAHGLDVSGTVERSGAQVQTAEILGVLHSDAIAEDDILLGRYDGAKVESWRVNWRDVSQRALIRTDTIGEIVREDGVFRAELRSGQHALNIPRGRLYQHLCDARLGDGRCKFNLDQPAYLANAAVTAIQDSNTIIVSGLGGYADGWFAHGLAQWSSGRRQGIEDAITRHGGDRLSFGTPVGAWVEIGDVLTIVAGCDKQFGTCREKFSNGMNFQGFPHIPGTDFVLRYPNSSDRLDGGVMVR